jgi:hypothetical protein
MSPVLLPLLKSLIKMLRSPRCHLYYLTIYRLDSTYSRKENTLALPSSHNIHLIPCHGLRPRRARITSPCPIETSGDESIAYRQKDIVGLRNNKYFGAQSLHLRCISVSHPPGFTTARYQTGCMVQF